MDRQALPRFGRFGLGIGRLVIEGELVGAIGRQRCDRLDFVDDLDVFDDFLAPRSFFVPGALFSPWPIFSARALLAPGAILSRGAAAGRQPAGVEPERDRDAGAAEPEQTVELRRPARAPASWPVGTNRPGAAWEEEFLVLPAWQGAESAGGWKRPPALLV